LKKLALELPITRRTGRILDIGSGNNPLDIATHLVDAIPDKNSERAGDLELPRGKAFTEGSVEGIPFGDKYFDFVHSAHVLEHVVSPYKAVQELLRVADAGYIETPAPAFEQGLFFGRPIPGWSFHRWYVWTFPGVPRLYFKPKTPRNVRSYCACPAGRAYERLLAAVDFLALEPLVPYYCRMTQFGWRGAIDLEVWDEERQGRNPGPWRDCDCPYAAFFSWLEAYFRSWRYFTKRLKLGRKLPKAHALIQGFLKGTV
jgi:SAM-dependent methyltransferase